MIWDQDDAQGQAAAARLGQVRPRWLDVADTNAVKDAAEKPKLTMILFHLIICAGVAAQTQSLRHMT